MQPSILRRLGLRGVVDLGAAEKETMCRESSTGEGSRPVIFSGRRHGLPRAFTLGQCPGHAKVKLLHHPPSHVIPEHRGCEEHRVDPVQHATVSWEYCSRVLNSRAAFDK